MFSLINLLLGVICCPHLISPKGCCSCSYHILIIMMLRVSRHVTLRASQWRPLLPFVISYQSAQGRSSLHQCPISYCPNHALLSSKASFQTCFWKVPPLGYVGTYVINSVGRPEASSELKALHSDKRQGTNLRKYLQTYLSLLSIPESSGIRRIRPCTK